MMRPLLILLLLPVSAASFTITFVGDIVLGQDYRFYGKTFDWQYSLLSEPKETYFFSEDVREILKMDDITVGNFEGTLTRGDIQPTPDKKFVFTGKPEYAQILRQNSIEVVNLANNHAPYDYGKKGFKETQGNLISQGVQFYGYDDIWGYSSESNVALTRVCICGLESFGSQKKTKGDIDKYLEMTKGKCEFMVFTFHWGIERSYHSSEHQKAIGRYAIDKGADLVVGHHPHVVQEIEDYKGKKIVYSLGNFIFGGNRNPKDKEAIMFQASFGKYSNDYKVIPIYTSSVKYRNDYRIVLRDK